MHGVLFMPFFVRFTRPVLIPTRRVDHFRSSTRESARGSYCRKRLVYEALQYIISKSRYEPRFVRATPRKRVVNSFASIASLVVVRFPQCSGTVSVT